MSYFAFLRASILARFLSNRLREALCQFLCFAIFCPNYFYFIGLDYSITRWPFALDCVMTFRYDRACVFSICEVKKHIFSCGRRVHHAYIN